MSYIVSRALSGVNRAGATRSGQAWCVKTQHVSVAALASHLVRFVMGSPRASVVATARPFAASVSHFFPSLFTTQTLTSAAPGPAGCSISWLT